MDPWRKYFSTSGIDIWTLCERALTLAYQGEDAEEFAAHRDRLAQKLFAPEKLDQEEMENNPPKAVPTAGPAHQGSRDLEDEEDADIARVGSSDQDQWHPNGHYDQAQAVTEEMDEESLLKRDVLELKEIILDSYKSEREILDCLQRLKLMQLSFDVLKETQIGKAVNSLRKHSSARIRNLTKQLVSDWKDTAEHWYKTVKDVTQASITVLCESPSDREEHGLPSPPMDEGALLAGRSTSIEMSQLFEFMADETSAGDLNCNFQKTIQKKSGLGLPSNQHGDSRAASACRKQVSEEVAPEARKNIDVRKRERELLGTDGHMKGEHDECTTMNGHKQDMEKAKALQHEAMGKSFICDANSPAQSSKPIPDPKVHHEKLLASRRKLQENYQQAECAKRQRTIQVMELEDLPKGGPKRSKSVFHSTRGGKSSFQLHHLQTFRH